ncbi:MAG: DNA (cytosine-5-)-methyltransferase [Thermoguttaceae bacterium]|nr:DNA (cytosine-5-)-methyltransferase [Thermoguttaceae bacterium]
MKNKDVTFRLGELFCGPGGLALAAALVGERGVKSDDNRSFYINHLWGVDKDVDAIDTYKNNIVGRFGGEAICKDAFEFVNSMTDGQKSINAFAFGFPCNDFSSVGNQTGLGGKFGNLYQAGISVIKLTNPDWFVAENVSGINSADGGNAFKRILIDLANTGKGYNITPHLYKFEEYGVPQLRHRFIIVGIRKDLNRTFKVPVPTTQNLEMQIPVEKALEGISADCANHDFPRMSQSVVKRLQLTPPGKNAWFLDELLSMSPDERRKIIESLPWYKDVFKDMTDDDVCKMIMESKLNCKCARMSHIYRRLQGGLPSYTITGSGGGGTHVYHWCEHRALTNRERARIQTFPDWFKFSGSLEKVRKQIGMAVPTGGAIIIFESILKTFAGIQYDSIESNVDTSFLQSYVKTSINQKSSISKIRKDNIIELINNNCKFSYSDKVILKIKGFNNRSGIIYTIKDIDYHINLKDINLVLELFKNQQQITEDSLSTLLPNIFSSKVSSVKDYKEFFVIALFDELGIGKKCQPYPRKKIWALKPITEE